MNARRRLTSASRAEGLTGIRLFIDGAQAFSRDNPFLVRKSRGPALCKSSTHPSVDSRVTAAYVRLLSVPESNSGARTVSLARFGKYDVRILEFARTALGDDPPLWMELYDHEIRTAVDSCRCGDLEDAVHAAEHLLSEAKQLSEGRESSRAEGEID